MTIFKPNQQDKKDSKSPEDPDVVTEPLTGGVKEDPAAPKVVRVTYGPNSNRTYINLCLIIAALIVLGAGIIGAIFLYRHLSHRVITGRCGVGFYDDIYHQQSDYLRGNEPLSTDLTRPDEEIGFKLDFFEETVEVSDVDGYERLQVPKFDECENTEVWHDFQQNYTAIVDHPHGNCFVMKLNRSLVAPPKDVIDLLTKLENGDYYFPRAEVVRQKYAVVTPAMDDLKVFGPYIMRECFWYDTFRLEKIVSGVFKRSAGSEPPVVRHIGYNTFRVIYKMAIQMPKH